MPGIKEALTVVRKTLLSTTAAAPTTVKPFDRIPGPSGIYNVPVVGTALLLYPFSDIKLNKLHRLFRYLHQKYGKIVKFRSGLKETVFLFDPEYIAQAMQNEGKYPDRTTMPIIQAYYTRTGKRSLSIFQGEEWQRIRSPLQQKLKPAAIATYTFHQESCANDLTEWINQNKNNSPDLKLAISHYVTDANSVALFNKQLRLITAGKLSKNNENVEFLKNVNIVFESVAKSVYTANLFRFLRTPLYNRYEAAMDSVLGFCVKRVEEELETGRKHPEENILYALINDESIPKEAKPFALAMFMYAGIETTTNAILWLLYCLAAFPEKQEVLWDEIKETCPDSLTVQAIGHMPYLKACLKETFRSIFPTVNGSIRKMPEDLEIGGYCIPKGTLVNFCHNALSRSPEYFEDPDDFIPERWLSGQNSAETQRLMSICSLPFGFGKRNCLGRRLAEQEIFIAVIKILQKFSLSLSSPQTLTSIDSNVSYRGLVVTDVPLTIQFTARCM